MGRSILTFWTADEFRAYQHRQEVADAQTEADLERMGARRAIPGGEVFGPLKRECERVAQEEAMQ